MTSRAMTLIEVLVALGIMACLLILLVSGLRPVRDHARVAVCSSNQRQLLLAMNAYDQACGRLPYGLDPRPKTQPPGGWAGDLMRDPVGWWWFHLLGMPTPRPMIRNILACPASRLADPALRRVGLYGQLGVNWTICRSSVGLGSFRVGFCGDPCSLARIHRPGQTLLIVDSGYALIGWPHMTADPPATLGDRFGYETAYLPGLGINHQRKLWCIQKTDATTARHPAGTINVGWLDGHVDRRRPSELQVTRTEYGYINITPTWAPTAP